MNNIFAFCNQKGGVGKTTTAINLAALIGKLGFKVLVIDMDAQANATSGLGEEKPTIESTTYQLIVEKSDPNTLIRQTKIQNVYLIPSNADLSGADIELINHERREFILKNQLNLIADKYDFVFIDCPPSLGLISINALSASNYIIIPIQCEYYALEGLGQLLNVYKLVQSNLNPGLKIGGVVLTMADFRTNLTQQVIEEIKNYFKEKVFHAIVPRSVKVSEAPSFGQPVVIYDPQNRAAKSYELIAHEFVGRFSKKSDQDGQVDSHQKPPQPEEITANETPVAEGMANMNNQTEEKPS